MRLLIHLLHAALDSFIVLLKVQGLLVALVSPPLQTPVFYA